MEHDIEKIIYQKIREAERVPVSWRKDEVWIRLEKPTHPWRRALPYAAALLLMLLAGGYWHSVPQQQLGLAKNMERKNPEIQCLSIAPPVSPASLAMHRKIRPRQTDVIRILTDSVSIQPPLTAVEQDSLQPPFMASRTATEAFQEEPQAVSAIVGIIPPPAPEQAAVRRRKGIRMKLFPVSPEGPYSPSVESKLIIARIQ